MTDALLFRPRDAIGLPVLRVIGWMEAIPYWAVALITRLSIAGVFWQSGETKVEGWHVTASAIELFRSEYRLPLIDPTLAAHLAAFAEHFFRCCWRSASPRASPRWRCSG